MKTPITIHVTQKHIDDARAHEADRTRWPYYPSCHCAVSLALCEVLGPGSTSNESLCGRSGATFFTPPEAAEFIRRFDFGVDVQPFSFTLTPR